MKYRQAIHNLHKRYLKDGDIGISEITRIGDIKYRHTHHVIDRVVYGRFWRFKKLKARIKR